MKKFKIGWKQGVSNHDHHRGLYRDCIGSSFIKKFDDQSPAHARETVTNPSDPTSAMIIGNAFHSTALGFPDEVLVVDKPKTPKQVDGKYQIHSTTHENILAMVEALNRHRIAKNFMGFKEREVTGIWHDVNNRLWCKIRPDLISHEERIIVDLKSTTDASYKAFNRDIFKFGYHVSAAWYKYGAEQITGHGYAFIIAAVEKTPPYGVNCFNITGLAIKKAWDMIGNNLGDLADCVQDDKWPSYKPFLHEPDVPGWII